MFYEGVVSMTIITWCCTVVLWFIIALFIVKVYKATYKRWQYTLTQLFQLTSLVCFVAWWAANSQIQLMWNLQSWSYLIIESFHIVIVRLNFDAPAPTADDVSMWRDWSNAFCFALGIVIASTYFTWKVKMNGVRHTGASVQIIPRT